MKYRTLNDSGPYPLWLRQLAGKSGAYVIRSALTGRCLYVGESHTGKLRKTLTRHFQAWSGPTSGARYNRGDVEVAIVITTPANAVAKQDALTRTLKPKDKSDRLARVLPF